MSALKEFLGIELPIIQAPMAGVQDSELAIAVSESGGLGSLACALLSIEQMRSEFEAIRSRTQRPINANFFCHSVPEADTSREAVWRARLQPYYGEFGITAENLARPVANRRPFDEQSAELVEEFRPAIVSFHFGLPAPALMARVKATGAKILSSATTVDEALWLESRGVDGIIAQGAEAGGHRGMFLSADVSTQMGTLALVPQIARVVKVPVIAAGGIADAAGVRACLALGAFAAQVGTAYMLCPEAKTSALHREALKSAEARHTAITNVFTGRPARGIVNRAVRELGPMSDLAPAFPLAAAALVPLRAAAERKGDSGFSPLWCGQNASGCLELPAAEITLRLAN